MTPQFVEAYAGRMINIHPALLPSTRGSTPMLGRLPTGCGSMGALSIS